MHLIYFKSNTIQNRIFCITLKHNFVSESRDPADEFLKEVVNVFIIILKDILEEL